MSRYARNHWQHYKIHRQPVGRPTDHGIDWSYPWQVTRPSNHPLMQGDNWELFAYQMFDTFEHAVVYATWEAAKDKTKAFIEDWIEDHMHQIVRAAIQLQAVLA